jgi:muramidase (phage lysozyme)
MDPSVQRQKELAAETKAAADKMKYLRDILKDRLAGSAMDFGKALGSSGEGLGKFSGSITGATGAIGDFLGNFNMASKVIGGFVKLFGGLAAASLKQNDDLMKSYENLSRMGSITTGGLEGLEKQLGSIGLMASEAEQLENVLKPVTKQLSQFGGSVLAGRDKMLQVVGGLIGPNNEYERQLRKLGYSVQDIREGAADYIQRQTVLGLAQGKSQAQLTRESVHYMNTLKQLQELTGMSRDEAQKALDMQLADARMGIYLRGMKKEEADSLQAYLVAYETKFGKEAAAGVKELIYNEGRIVGDLSAQAYQSTRGTAYKAAMDAAKGGPEAFSKSIRTVAEANNSQVKQIRNTIMIAGEGVKDLSGNFEMINGSAAILALSEEELGKDIKKNIDDAKANKGRLDQNIVNEQKLRAIRVAGDQALYEAGNLVVNMFTKLNDVMFKFAKMIASVVDKFSETILGKKTNLSAQFRDIEDNVEDTKVATREHASLLRQLADAENDYKLLATANTATLKKQIDAQDALVADLEKRSKDSKLSELERTRAEVEWYEARRRKNLLYEQYGATRGGGDLAELRRLRVDRIVQLQKELGGTQEKLNTLQKENNTMSSKLGVRTGAQREDIAAGQVSSQSDTKLGKLLDFIGRAEGAGYNTLVGGGTTNLTEMTVQEVLDFQKTMTKERGYISSALGKYQFINSTLSGLVSQLNIDKNTKFSPELQDKLAKQLVSSAGYEKFQQGKLSKEEFLDSLAKVWASLPLASGKSAYANDGVNKATVSRQDALSSIPQGADGGFFSGPREGYLAMLHGNEWVIKEEDFLNATKGIKQSMSTALSQMPTAAPTNNNIMDTLVETLSEKLESLIEETRKSIGIQDEILTYTRS